MNIFSDHVFSLTTFFRKNISRSGFSK